MLLKACPRCKGLIPYGLPYCAACRPIAEAEREANKERKRALYNRGYNARRANDKYRGFYRSKEWKRTSLSKLQAVGWRCEARLEKCQGIAVEVHHIKPIQTEQGWTERLEWSNLEAVCTACHNGRHPEKMKRKQDPNVQDMRAILQEIKENPAKNVGV